ncbi:phytoene dehydrogenase [Herbaspirillum rubrisubalbicans]|uniref:Phytoene dehydrogenase n=1 Tax=Herbaspirillum rubrisubalbicans TaxID=80842 RepID=A0ABX9BZ39_9BURK|nr:hydroxysqualene dehydroxylase HpnE [Herbaspirillum rubrisubalbicans]RAM63300.1 phytoene dehydrogenase [Herbaspirillum rubrisubalbicans]RAN48483.1 phytoene dehydrogenase [Herbaspirillum rubrisubalbicans]
MHNAPRHHAVIGAGWAGCAAAVALAAGGHRVSLFEAARTLGGRARRVELDGQVLDNGQHILLGAYRATLALMKQVGVDPARALLRLPLQMRYPLAAGSEGMDFVAPRLPAPWHLAVALWRAKGLAREDKMALARFSTTARWMGWQLHQDCSVAELLERFEQTPRLIRLMWRPLCIAALNTAPEQASAQVFLNVLRDSLGARRAASDMLIPRLDLGALLPDAAAAYLEQRGALVHTGVMVSRLLPGNEAHTWRLQDRAGENLGQFAGVVLATGPEAAAQLLAGQHDTGLLQALRHEPITTCYLQYPDSVRLPAPFLALADDAPRQAWGQFVFDRGQLGGPAGCLAVVVSAAGQAIAEGHAALAAGITRQLATDFALPALATPQWRRVITEKRATFACTPGLQRPDNAAMPAGLALAGDYVAGDYPATLEGAVRSGLAAARLLVA